MLKILYIIDKAQAIEMFIKNYYWEQEEIQKICNMKKSLKNLKKITENAW